MSSSVTAFIYLIYKFIVFVIYRGCIWLSLFSLHDYMVSYLLIHVPSDAQRDLNCDIRSWNPTPH